TGAPPGLTAVIGNARVLLAWSVVAGATSYNVYRGTAPGGEGATPLATGVSVAGFTDTTAAAGNTYYYTVAAVDPGGTSPASNEASVTVDLPLSAPVIVAQPANQFAAVGGAVSFSA